VPKAKNFSKTFAVKLPNSEAIAFERLLQAEGINPNRYLRQAIAQAVKNQASKEKPRVAS
jgi:hypothetical protein